MAMVVMDKEGYTYKALALLAEYNNYIMTKYPTTKLKNKLAQTLRDITNQVGLSDHSYKKVYPTSAVPQNLMAFPKYTRLAPP